MSERDTPPRRLFAGCDFGPYTLLPQRRLLLRHGQPVPLGGRAFDLLQLLLEHHAQVVGKGEILDRVWAGCEVEEGNIAVQMSELRRVLGPEWVCTIARRGYAFKGVVRFADASPRSGAPVAPQNDAAWVFGEHAVLPQRRLLLRQGRPLPVRGRAFDLLRLLLEHHDRVVAPSEMLNRVWSGRPVGEGNIATQLSHLRGWLGAPCIRTVPHRGYQFTAEVRWASDFGAVSSLHDPTT